MIAHDVLISVPHPVMDAHRTNALVTIAVPTSTNGARNVAPFPRTTRVAPAVVRAIMGTPPGVLSTVGMLPAVDYFAT